MSNYAKTKRIPLEKATKEELIAGIKAVWSIDAVEQAEKAIYWARQQSLLDKMHALTDKLDALRAQPNACEYAQIGKRVKLHKQFTRINNQLSKLQGL